MPAWKTKWRRGPWKRAAFSANRGANRSSSGSTLWRSASRRDPARPGNHQGIANAAAMGVLLVATQRRVGRHGPAVREIRARVRAADIVDAGELLLHRLGSQIER